MENTNTNKNPLNAADLSELKITVYEPFSDFLHGTEEEKRFTISLLDVARFAGHTCPSVTGAFLLSRAAIKSLFPESGECIRGDLEIDIPGPPDSGPMGPIANVFSFITGAWSDTGFGGLKGQYRRRGLLRFESSNAPKDGYRFKRISTGLEVDVFYHPSRVPYTPDPNAEFQDQWRGKISAILKHSDLAVEVVRIAATD